MGPYVKGLGFWGLGIQGLGLSNFSKYEALHHPSLIIQAVGPYPVSESEGTEAMYPRS